MADKVEREAETLSQYADRIVANMRKRVLDKLNDDVIGDLGDSHLIFGKMCAIHAVQTAMDEMQQGLALLPTRSELRHRIDRTQYPEIIQALRWMDEDNGTNHFKPGIGFIVDDPEGASVPTRWVDHLDTIEKALAGLDHAQPHPSDIDTIEWLAKENKEPTIYEAAVCCFVRGEHTPVTEMARSSEDLWIANRFFNEYFEGWLFDPSVGFVVLPDTEQPSGK